MHTAEHDEGCAAIAAGDDGEVPQALKLEIAGCAECARRIVEMRDVRRDLSRLGEDDRELLARAAEVRADRAEAAVVQRLRQLARASAPRARPVWRSPWLALAAGVAVLITGWLLWRSPPPAQPDRQLLGNGEHFREMHPSGSDDPISPMTWIEEIDVPGGTYRVTVRETDGSGLPLIVKSDLREPSWTLSDEELARMPRSFEWRVEVMNGTSSWRPSPWVAASPKR